MPETVTLKEHLERIVAEMDLRYQQRFDAQKEALAAAFAAAKEAVGAALTAADRAVAKAEIAADKRYDALNELRGAMNDQAAGMMTKDYAEARFGTLQEKYETLKDLASASGGKSGANTQNLTWAIAIGSVLIVLADHFLK